MTLEERLCLARAGYSAQDIAGFEEAQGFAQTDQQQAQQTDQQQAQQTDQQAQQTDQQQAQQQAQQPDKPIWAAALEKSISDLTKAMQASNRQFVDMGDPETPAQQAEEALAKYLTGTQPEKNKSGGKRK